MGKPNIYQRLRHNGFSSPQIAYMKGIAQQASREMEQDATERAFLYMLAIPLNVLADRGIIDKDNAADYIKDVASLYLSVQNGIVTEKDLADLLKEYAGIEFAADWMDKLIGRKGKAE